MKTLTIKRVVNDDSGMYGVMVYGNQPFAVTLEPPWKDNQPEVSCIPAGTYICMRVMSPKFGDVFEITQVHGRSHILIHKGNVSSDTLGCVMVGESFAQIGNQDGIADSRHGFAEMMEIVRDVDVFRIIIVDDWNNPLETE